MNVPRTDIWKIKRLDPRITLLMPVIIEGTDPSGNPYRDETITENVSKMGACIITGRNLRVGEQVTFSSSGGQFKCEALVKIVWTDNTDKKQKAGLQFLERPRNWVVN
jgi:hypothetical protein